MIAHNHSKIRGNVRECKGMIMNILIPHPDGCLVTFCSKSLTDAKSKEYGYECTVVAIGVTDSLGKFLSINMASIMQKGP